MARKESAGSFNLNEREKEFYKMVRAKTRLSFCLWKKCFDI